MTQSLRSLSQKLGYTFKNEDLLRAALTHRSASGQHNERLEFLGDSLLNFIIADKLFDTYPDAKEGELSRWRASLVKGETLADLAKELSLSEFLQLGTGEVKSGGAQRRSILANAMEAIIGAIYLDGGIHVCQDRVLHWFAHHLLLLGEVDEHKDPKSRLQEYLQAQKLPLPIYKVVSVEGAAHLQNFVMSCQVTGLAHKTEGSGTSRRRAEQAAAQAYLDLLGVSL